MGRLVALNGRNTASVVAYFLDRDPTVLAWWHQPFEYQWKIIGPTGKATGTKRHEPQFVVLRDDGFVVLDFVDDGELIKRSDAGQDYVLDPSDHSWRWLTAEREYALIGLRYEVRSRGDIPFILHQNLRDLDRYQDDACLPLAQDERDRLLVVFASEGFMSVRECVDRQAFSGDTIRRALVEGLIVADLVHTHLVSPECLVFRDLVLLDGWLALQAPAPALPLPADEEIDENEIIQYHGHSYCVRAVDGDEVFLQGIGADMRIVTLRELEQLKAFIRKGQGTGGLEPRIRAEYVNLSDGERELGMARLNWIEGRPESRIKRPSTRSLQRWRAIANVESTRIRKIVALGRNRRSGNRSERFTARHETLVRRIVRHTYDATPKATKSGAYAAYLSRFPCRIAGIKDPMSEMAFNHRVDLYSDPVRKHGKRAAYQRANLSGLSQFNNSPHGALPHQIVHVDHTEVDVEAIYPDGRNLGRPWLTLFWDASMKRARAMVLTFRKPNTESILLGIRDYVRREKCLPKLIVVDGAAELKTANVREIETAYGIEIRTRKGSEGRSGSPIENRLGSREKEVDQQMHGNTSHLKAARAYTGKISPKDDAEWTLPVLYQAYENYFFEYLGKVYKDPSWGETAVEHEWKMRKYCGEKEFIPAEYDFSLLVQTAPILLPSEHKVQTQGVFANCAYFTNRAIRRLKPGAKVPVRGEPHCANIVYVKIGKKWTIAIGRDLRLFEGFTLYQASIATQEWRRQNRSLWRASKRSPRANEIRSALTSAKRFDARLLELQQEEEARLRNHLGLDVSLDENGTHVCFGVRKPLEASRSRASQVASNQSQCERLKAPATPGDAPRVASLDATSIESDGLAPTEATDDFTVTPPALAEKEAVKEKSATRRHRAPRVLGDDAWRKTGFV